MKFIHSCSRAVENIASHRAVRTLIRATAALGAGLLPLAVSAQTAAPVFQLIKAIALPGITGKFDHLTIDEAGNRLFIAGPGNHSVEVIDLKTDKVQQSITGLGKPHGLAWVAATSSLYVSDGSLAELRVYKGTPLALAGKIKLSDDADDMVYNDASHLLFVAHGGKDAANPAMVAIVNTGDFSLVANVPVATHPEGLDIDAKGGRVFANLADSGEVAVIDTATKAITAHWKLTKATDNVPMAFDSEDRVLYIACRTPGTVIALDAATGKEAASQAAAGGIDDLFYDAALRRVYAISGAGEVDAYQADGAKSLKPLEVLHTAAGAKTALFVAARNLLYVGVPGAGEHPAEIRIYATVPSSLPSAASAVQAQSSSQAPAQSVTAIDEDLKFVVIVSRHGVRSPTGKLDQLNQYSRQPWPAWSVPAGYLTEHGFKLMTLFGAYDREQLASQGLLAPSGCEDASQISIVADSDQRTRETGKALAAGLAPGCALDVQALPEGTHDPLFHSMSPGDGHPDHLLATAAISGRIGANPQGLVEAYRPQLEALQEVLQGCKAALDCASPAGPKLLSIFDLPSSIGPGQGNHLVEFHTPLGIASTMAENLLLEYTEGMDAAQVGWGRVNLDKLRELMRLHTASEDISGRTSYVARLQSSSLLFHVVQSMAQAASGQPVAGALSKPGDRLLIVIGHDTNLANIGGALGLNWLIDGRRDDTPPGGALVFELWKSRGTGVYSVHTYFMAQTLDQMRNVAPLSLQSPPERVPVFVPGCGQGDGSCSWSAFQQTIQAAIDSSYVK